MADQSIVDLGKKTKSEFPGKYDSYTDEQVGTAVQKLHPDLAKKKEPSAWGEYWSNFAQTANPVPGWKTAAKFGLAVSSPGRAASPEGQKSITEAKEAFIDPQVRMAKEGVEEAKQGHLGGAATRLIEAAVPGAGPAVAAGGEQWSSGHRAAALGTWSGILGPMLLGMGASKVAKGAYRGAAEATYRTGLKFDKSVPIKERSQIVDRGLGRDVSKAAGESPGGGTPATHRGLDKIEKRLQSTKPLQRKEIQDITKAGRQTIDRDYIIRPLEEEADRYRNAGAPKQAKVLDDLVDEFKQAHGNQYLTVEEVQKIKEDTDRLLSSKDFGDKELTGQKHGHEMKRTAMRDLIERADEAHSGQSPSPIERMNWAMHLDQSLRTAIETALKSDRGFLSKVSPFFLGIAAESIPRTFTDPVIGHTILAGIILREIAHNPGIISHVGIALDKAGVAVPAALKTAAISSPFMIGANTKDLKMPDAAEGPPTVPAPQKREPPVTPKSSDNPYE